MTACMRCRKKKRRCDQQRPTCRLCKLAGVECVEFDATAQQLVSRSYVPSLERRIAYLESKLQENGIQDIGIESTQEPGLAQSTHSTPSHLGSGTSPLDNTLGESSHLTDSNLGSDGRALVNRVVNLARSAPEPQLTFSQVLQTELLRSTSSAPRTRPGTMAQSTSSIHIPSDISAILDTSTVSLPPGDTAQSLIKAYFQHTSLNLPLLHEPTLKQMLDVVYQMPRATNFSGPGTDTESRIAAFFVLEVFAVALLKMQKQDPSKISTALADRYHKMALDALNMASFSNDVRGVQALLLIAQYSYYHPNFWAAWRTVGAALRLAVELGLHQDVSSGTNALEIDTKRRTFWTAYSMDRNLSVAMSMPLCLSDGAISAQFPSDVADQFITPDGIISTEPDAISESKRIALHMFRYRQIQSELRSMLWDRRSPYAQVNFGEWQQHMRVRIDNWYDSIPLGDRLGNFERGILQTFEVTHSTALFQLYRPTLNNPAPAGQEAVAMSQAAAKMIQLYHRFFRQQQLTIYWQSIENIFSAGTALMLAYTQFSEVRDVITFRSLETLIHTCSSLLWGLVERFPSFQGKREAFDISAARVLEDLNSGSSGTVSSERLMLPKNSDANEQNSCSFTAQSEYSFSLLSFGQTPFPEGDDHQSWFQFLTPDDFTLHSDGEPLLFQDLDISAFLGNGPPTENNTSS